MSAAWGKSDTHFPPFWSGNFETIHHAIGSVQIPLDRGLWLTDSVVFFVSLVRKNDIDIAPWIFHRIHFRMGDIPAVMAEINAKESVAFTFNSKNAGSDLAGLQRVSELCKSLCSDKLVFGSAQVSCHRLPSSTSGIALRIRQSLPRNQP